ncbi:prepilin-type cleavage/methylation domain-containing protein [Alteromonas sp. IB21]|uniref:prepilin-type cleavage/methylation domain-containing protein n=1 Tax=Alteromonas sp. IB21 TaxID=2779369 RepID=UPI0018E75BCA|nr:prepilin-type cleavage/methylation domain-containing protein [Alteromonas sp. IB21]MBJ2129998.1 prepilin-type cleavage/methylation domain-containing protein [Alteromonas sp. IB21]
MAFWTMHKGKHTNKRPNTMTGLSLFELLVSLLILSILSLLTVPSFQRWQEKNAFKHFATRVTELAKQTRIQSLAQQKTFYLIAKIETDNCLMVSADQDCSCASYQTCALNEASYWELPTAWNTKLRTVGSTDKTVAFNKHGTLNFGSNTTFTLSSERFNAKVTFSSLGRIRLCSEQYFVGIAPC